MTLHELMNDLTGYLNLTPEQQFRVTAKIKRYMHGEKSELCGRLAMYLKEEEDSFIHSTLIDKADSHAYWFLLPDKELVTWDVGTHKYMQQRPPCSECGVNLTGAGISFASINGNGIQATFCKSCVEKGGLWAELREGLE